MFFRYVSSSPFVLIRLLSRGMLPLLHPQLLRRHHPVINHRHRLPMGLRPPQDLPQQHRPQRIWMPTQLIGAFRTFQGPGPLFIDNTLGLRMVTM